MISLLVAAFPALAADRLTYVTIDSAAEGRPLTYGVYTPPGWDGATPLPLVVFLHGGGDDARAWDDHPIVTRRLDQAITAGTLPPFLAVVPEGERGFWRNWGDGSHHYEDWVVEDVVGHARATLPIAGERAHLLGISMGGMGTAYIGLHHLDDFASLTVLSAPLFDGEQTARFLQSRMMRAFAPIDRIFADLDADRVRSENAWALTGSPGALGDTTLWVGAGAADLPGILPASRAFHDHLIEAGVPHTFEVFPGGHQWTAWSKVFPVALCRAIQGADCAPAPGRVAEAAAP